MPEQTPYILNVEQVGEIQVDGTQGDMTAYRSFHVRPFHAWYAFVKEAMGNQIGWMPGIDETFDPPVEHNLVPNLYCTGFRVEQVHDKQVSRRPEDGSVPLPMAFPVADALSKLENLGTANSYQANVAKVSLRYTPILDTEVEYNYGVRNLTQSTLGYTTIDKNNNDSALENQGIAFNKTLPIIDYALVKHYTREIPKEAVAQLLGRVNYDPYTFRWKNFLGQPQTGDTWDRECLLFDKLVARRRFSIGGENYFEVVYGFKIMSIFDYIGNDVGADNEAPSPNVADTNTRSNFPTYVGWNRIYNPQLGFYTRIKPKTNGSTAYNYDDLISQNINGTNGSGFDLLFTDGAS